MQRENGKEEWSSPKRKEKEGGTGHYSSFCYVTINSAKCFTYMISVMISILGVNFKRPVELRKREKEKSIGETKHHISVLGKEL